MDGKSFCIEKIIADRGIIHITGACPVELLRGVWGVYESCNFDGEAQKIADDAIKYDTSQLSDRYTTFRIRFQRMIDDRDRIYSSFRIKVELDNATSFTAAGPRYATVLNEISLHSYDYPKSHTIKGLQVKMLDDALRLGIGHAALNLNLPSIMIPDDNGDAITYQMDGEVFYFHRQRVEEFDRRVKELSENKVVVTLILLNSMKWDGYDIHPELLQELIHPDYDPDGLISAFPVVTERGLKRFRAFIEFIAERYTRPDQLYGRACGYILGNEVTSQWIWCNAGKKTVQDYMEEYTYALRMAFFAARKKYDRARVYISMDHFWTMTFQEDPLKFYKGREVLELLNQYSHRDGNFEWSVAYHPYPQNLFHADFWNDETAQHSFDTGRITFRNIEILSQFLSQKAFLYNGELRHIILSEQGFHSDENEESEALQAAAYCLAYRKVANTPGIESFILHAHVDNRDEFGLNLGLWRRDKSSPSANEPGSPKPIYDVFRLIDGPEHEEVCRFARKIVGEKNWV